MKKERFKKVLKAFKKRSFYVFIFCNLFATFLHFACNITIILKNYHVIFSGDVLFKNGIGRFDFPTSSSTDTRNSIKKIKEIKDDYEIYPGHGELTTLIQEKLNNPYLQ